MQSEQVCIDSENNVACLLTALVHATLTENERVREGGPEERGSLGPSTAFRLSRFKDCTGMVHLCMLLARVFSDSGCTL